MNMTTNKVDFKYCFNCDVRFLSHPDCSECAANGGQVAISNICFLLNPCGRVGIRI